MQRKENVRTRYNILVIDPDAEFADMVAQAIKDDAGTYSVTVDTSPRRVVDSVREAQSTQRPFDLLITDVRTADTDSMHMIEELVQSYPQLKIITMTAYHSPELAARVQQLNVYTYQVKPIAPSRFRQLVQNALAGKNPDAELASPPPTLSDAQQAAVERQLANLRRATSSTAALLVHTSGVIRAFDCLESGLDTAALGTALMDAQHSIAQALAQTMQAGDPVRQCYFGTASYSICVHRLDETHAVATIFGPEVREGQVWYALREGIEELQAALETKEPEAPPQQSPAKSAGFAMVERYFAQQTASQTRPRRGTRERILPVRAQETPARARAADEAPAQQATSVSERAASPNPPVPDTAPAFPPTPAPLEMERLEIDKIDWELQGVQDWDTLVADTDPSFQGMSFEEAKKRGLLDDLDAGP